MTEIVVFCTSAAADRKLLDQFNDHCGRKPLKAPPGFPPPFPKFISARQRTMIEEDDERSTDEPDLFDDWYPDQCAEFYTEYLEHERFIDKGVFVTMDERSSKDNTVVMHCRRVEDKKWESWRIKFEDAYYMYNGLTEDLEEYERVFTQADRFLDKDGIFPAQEASKIVRREERQS